MTYPLALAGWAQRWGLPSQALDELAQVMGAMTTVPIHEAAGAQRGKVSEAYAQSEVRLDAARQGVHLFRNNVGAMEDEKGRWVRFGLANDSPTLNAQLKSSDLVGFRPVIIGPHHVGLKIAQFVSRECKPGNWRYTGTPREIAQTNWHILVNSHGGDSKFATGPGTL